MPPHKIQKSQNSPTAHQPQSLGLVLNHLDHLENFCFQLNSNNQIYLLNFNLMKTFIQIILFTFMYLASQAQNTATTVWTAAFGLQG